MTAFRPPRLLHLLRGAFTVTLVWRFVYVFLYPPQRNLWSDPMRHWLNARRFFAPDYLGSADPLMYQVWLASVRWMSADHSFMINTWTGLLAVGVAWFWYKALREVISESWALAGGILIGLMPSLLVIYSYFMMETLLLPLVAAGVWLSLRALRMGTVSAFSWAALLWTLACFTRLVALPIAGVFLGALCIRFLRPFRPVELLLRGAIVVSLFIAMTIPACWHSRLSLNYCAPFGLTYLVEAQRVSQSSSIIIELERVKKGQAQPEVYTSYGFQSPGMVTRPLRPLSEWQMPYTGKLRVRINPENGARNWQETLQRVKRQELPFTVWQDTALNGLMFFVDPSWPDNQSRSWVGKLNIQLRWMWLPLTLIVGYAYLLRAPFLTVRQHMVPATAMLLISLLVVQQTATMEGRYRKPAEPFLLASVIILLQTRRKEVVSRSSEGIRGLPG